MTEKPHGIASMLKKGETEHAIIVIRPEDLATYSSKPYAYAQKYLKYLPLAYMDMVEATGPTDLATFLMPVEIRAPIWLLDKEDIRYQED